MTLNGQTYCNKCCLVISPGMKHMTFKIPGKDGSDGTHYLHYHNRYNDDCFGKEMAKLKQEHVPQWRHQ